jgi:hypothetical protein
MVVITTTVWMPRDSTSFSTYHFSPLLNCALNLLFFFSSTGTALKRHSKAKQEFGSDFIKPLSGTPPRQFALDSSSKFECAKTSSCEQEPDNFIIGGTNGLSPQLLGAIWADLDNVRLYFHDS